MILDKDETPGEELEEVKEEELWDTIVEDGRVVGTLDWDSGAPGPGAGIVSVYFYCGAFYADDENFKLGPFNTFFQAASYVGLLNVNEATTRLWIDPEFKKNAVVRRLLKLLERKTREHKTMEVKIATEIRKLMQLLELKTLERKTMEIKILKEALEPDKAKKSGA